MLTQGYEKKKKNLAIIHSKGILAFYCLFFLTTIHIKITSKKDDAITFPWREKKKEAFSFCLCLLFDESMLKLTGSEGV